MSRPARLPTPLRLLLVVHDEKPEAGELAGWFTAEATRRGIAATVLEGPGEPPADVIVSIGGDGTLLRAAAHALGRDLPLIGINLGRVGYLTEVEPDKAGELLSRLEARDLDEVARLAVRVTLPDGREGLGVNDVVMEKGPSPRVVHLTAHVNGARLMTYRADGVVVATPVGSTAYSLSAGGPVVDPAVDALIVTPVAAHTLLWRSVVVAPDSVLEFTAEYDREVWVNVDGRPVGVLQPGETARIERAARPIRFLSLGARRFPDAVREEFGLGHA